MRRVYCIHPAITDIDKMMDYYGLENVTSKDDIIWDKLQPEILIISEHIFFNIHCFMDFKRFRNSKKIIKIYVAGECISPDMNIFDYACVFDRKLADSDRIVRFPPQVLHRRSLLEANNTLDVISAVDELKHKTGFCCFIYSNAEAHPKRDELFRLISTYKRVDSLGRHLRNVKYKRTFKRDDWRRESIDIKKRYKFSIAAENACYAGYTSEKILTSFQSHSVPIYWGNPEIEEEFNSNAFINVRNFKNEKELIDRIMEIDLNDELWMKMIQEPWQTEEQRSISENEKQKYYEFWSDILYRKLSDLKRVPEGMYPDKYRGFYFRMNLFYFVYYDITRVLSKVKRKMEPIIR